jgi:hypothetical protein
LEGRRARANLGGLPGLLGELDVLGGVVLGGLVGRDQSGLSVLSTSNLLLGVGGLVLGSGRGRLLVAWGGGS